MVDLKNEMLWYNDAPSAAAERILRTHHQVSIEPAPNSNWRNRAQYAAHLQANGVGKHFSVKEIVTPNHVRIASGVGWADFTPPAFTWGVSSLLVWLADRMREAGGGSVRMRNHWRPQSYNREVATSGIESDHPNVCGVDLDFGSKAARRRAQKWLAEFISATQNVAEHSVGLGDQALHVGVLSPMGSRYWTHDNYDDPVPEVIRTMAELPGVQPQT